MASYTCTNEVNY